MARGSGGVKDVETWLTPSEAAKILGNSAQWVKQLARRDLLRGVETRLGWLIDPDDVERLLNERKEEAEKSLTSLKTARSRALSAGAGSTVASGRRGGGRAAASRVRAKKSPPRGRRRLR